MDISGGEDRTRLQQRYPLGDEDSTSLSHHRCVNLDNRGSPRKQVVSLSPSISTRHAIGRSCSVRTVLHCTALYSPVLYITVQVKVG